MTELENRFRSLGLPLDPLEPLFPAGPETVYYFHTHGSRAVEHWHRLRALIDHTGYWPVILGDEEDMERHRWNLDPQLRRQHLEEQAANRELSKDDRRLLLESAAALAHEPSVHQLIETAPRLDVPGILRAALAATLRDNEVEEYPAGEWPDDALPNHEYGIPFYSSGGSAKPDICIGLVPARESWQVPAFLRFQALYHHLRPEEHAAVLRRWQEQWGTEIVGVSDEVIEARVSRLPPDRDAAIALALEHFAYCPDMVWEGTGTVEELAAQLLVSTVWFFWWD